MKQKQMTVIAVACGVVCAVCVGLFMASVHGEADAARAEALARYGGEQVEAYVATRDIVAGERVDPSAVETKLWVADLLPEQAIRSSSDAVGKTVTSSIYKGEVITAGRFEVGAGAVDVPVGKQAVSVPSKAVQAVGGAIRAGMSVDVYSAGGASIASLAKGVSVLDTSVSSSGGEGWITLAVNPEKVEEFISASNKTTLYFTLPGQSVSDEQKDENRESGGAEAGKGASPKDGDDRSAAEGTPANEEASSSAGDGEKP